MRQQDFFLFEKKDGCLFSSILKKMDAKFASTIHSQISQSEAFLSLGLFDKTNLQIVPKNGLLYVQVIYQYPLSFTSEFTSNYEYLAS